MNTSTVVFLRQQERLAAAGHINMATTREALMGKYSDELFHILVKAKNKQLDDKERERHPTYVSPDE